MSDDRQWIFYDSMSKTQSNPITSSEAQMAIFKMKIKDWRRFYVWTTGWDDWQPLELFLTSEQTHFIVHFKAAKSKDDTVKFNTRDVLEMSKVTKKTHKEITKSFSGVALDENSFPQSNPGEEFNSFDADELSWSETKKPTLNFKKLKDRMAYGRRDMRHELKIEILLISARGTLFRSISKNISLSGSLLEDNIPFDFYGVTFEAIIVNRNATDPKKERVPLKAKTVGEGLTQRLSFHEITDRQKKDLQNLLEDYLDQQKKSTAKSG